MGTAGLRGSRRQRPGCKEPGGYGGGSGENGSVPAALGTAGAAGPSCGMLLPGPSSSLTYLFLHASANTCAAICSSALEVGHPGTILEFSVFKAAPLIGIIIMSFHYYLVSAH